MTGETAGENIDDWTIHTKATAIVVKDRMLIIWRSMCLKIDVTVTQGDGVLTGFVNSRETEERLVAKIGESRVWNPWRALKVEEKK